MLRRNKSKPNGGLTASAVLDAFSNPTFRLGYGSQSPLEATEYPLTRMTDNYALLNSLYRDNWVVQNVVGLMVDDMLREWYHLSGDVPPEALDKLAREERKTKLRHRINEGLRWGRLYGGAAGIIQVDGQEDLSKPLDLELIYPGSFQGLYILDRWQGITPNMGLVLEAGEEVPESYSIVDGRGHTVANVHHSRVVRFTGRELPRIEREAELYWGESEVEALYRDVVAHDNVSANMAALTFQANVTTQEVKGLEQLLSIAPNDVQRRFWAVMQAQSVLRTNFGTQVVEAGTKVSSHQYTFTGLSDVHESMCLNLCGASHYPMTKLFGRSPSGLNATGESDLKNYYDYVDANREAKLRPVLERLIPVLCMSAWGQVPEDMDITFPPLWTPTAKEVAEIAKAKSETIVAAYQAGLLNVDTAQKELKKLEEETGLFGNISDEEIARNAGKTYADATSLHDPLVGYSLGGEVSAPFDSAARDAAVTDYNPYRDPTTGRYASGPKKKSTTTGSRGKLGMSKTERKRVSSGILTDHPDLKSGDISNYLYGEYFYRFVVNGPGNYTFVKRVRIEGNQAYIDLFGRR